MPEETTLGADFARAFAEKDADRMRELLHPEVDFRGLTPNRAWEASGREAVVEVLFGSWLEDSDHVKAVESIEGDTVVDRERVGYRLSVSNPDGRFLVEQQAYMSTRDGQIDWIRVVCSGFRPAP
jgi:ketosteroid isomerase-like protein